MTEDVEESQIATMEDLQRVVKRILLRRTGKNLPTAAIRLVHDDRYVTPSSASWPTRTPNLQYYITLDIAGTNLIRFRTRHGTSVRSMFLAPGDMSLGDMTASVVAGLRRGGATHLAADKVAFESVVRASVELVETADRMRELEGTEMWVVDMQRAPEGTKVQFVSGAARVAMDVSMLTFGQIRRLVHDRLAPAVPGASTSASIQFFLDEGATATPVHGVADVAGHRVMRVKWV